MKGWIGVKFFGVGDELDLEFVIFFLFFLLGLIVFVCFLVEFIFFLFVGLEGFIFERDFFLVIGWLFIIVFCVVFMLKVFKIVVVNERMKGNDGGNVVLVGRG